MGTKTEALLADESSITEIDELRPLIAEGQERGFLTFEQIASCLEEVEVTKEQVSELHAYLEDQGIDVVGDDGKPGESARPAASSASEPADKTSRRAAQAGDRPHGRAEPRLAAALPALDRPRRSC